MAPSLPPCIGNAFCSHRQASCVLLVTLVPFFIPFLILCVPFLLLFLAPLSSLLLSLLLLYKVQVSISSRRRSSILSKDASGKLTGLTEASSIDKEGRRWQVLPGSAEELDGSNLQSTAVSSVRDGEDSHQMSSSASSLIGEEPDDVKELDARDELEQRHADRNVIEGIEEVLPDTHREHAIREGLHVIASPSTESATEHTKGEEDFPVEGMPLDLEKQSDVQEQNMMDASLQDKILTPLPSTQDQGSLQATSEEGHNGFHHPSSSIPAQEQGDDSGKDLPAVDSGVHESVVEFEEVPWKDVGDEIFEMDAPHIHLDTQEQGRQDLGLPSQKHSSCITLDFGGRPEKHDLPSSMEKGAEEDETSCSATDGFERERAEAVAKELQDEALPQKGMLASDLQDSPGWDQPFEASSSAPSSTQRPFEHVENQGKVQDEHRILADIFAIKKIVGYEGEVHASVMEQITALYLFLGMEPYKWDVEVDELERAQAETELLKVVVGVK
ncbi:hypothetical protein GOP47_0022366 [Adiantum capillus-veneris]|uniref:Uncharacterized protein n=1 Tax=Adiantum capillus-veneris TaxID=13818 RepID=A0A9D4U6C0_ADICA|nr:hypothetical protein GOP47_0022366 [Adiantum capillus-veneris]